MLSSLVSSPTLDLSNTSKPRPISRARAVSRITAIPPSTLARTTIALEYASLRHAGHCPLGMYVTPSAEYLTVWDAVFFVHQGASTSPPMPHTDLRCTHTHTRTRRDEREG